MRALLISFLVAVLLLPAAANAQNVKSWWGNRDLSYQVQYQLENDAILQQYNINIATASYAQVVLLVGEVPKAELKDRAATIAAKVSGVKTIYNQITIGLPISAATKTKDTWITTQVKSILLVTSGVPSGDIKVVTENGVVYLMGILTKEQGDAAAKAVSKASGVQKIVKIFEYSN